MEKENRKERELESINRKAAEWLARRQNGFSAQEQDEFFAWLAKDERHSERFAAHSRTWKRLDLLVQWKTEHSDVPNEDLLQVKSKVSYWPAWLGGAAALIAVGFLAFFVVQSGRPDGEMNLIAKEYERHRLYDGSYVDLIQGAALEIEYSEAERRLELVANEAHFEVTRDVDRPFIVTARGIEIEAVGTAFNVRIVEDQVTVLVTEGRVRLSKALGYQRGLEGASDPGSHFEQELLAGQMSIVSADSTESSARVSVAPIDEIRRIDEWRQSLEFDSIPLQVVVAEFNRRNEIDIVIDDPVLATMPIVASFHSEDSEQFIELIELMIDVEVTRDDDVIRLRMHDEQ